MEGNNLWISKDWDGPVSPHTLQPPLRHEDLFHPFIPVPTPLCRRFLRVSFWSLSLIGRWECRRVTVDVLFEGDPCRLRLENRVITRVKSPGQMKSFLDPDPCSLVSPRVGMTPRLP